MSEDQEQDMVLVNPNGRVIEVTNELGRELLSQPSQANLPPFRVANADEVKRYEAGIKAIAPAVLAKKEEQRLAEEKKAAEDYFKGENGEAVGAQPSAQSLQDKTQAEPSGSTEADLARDPKEGTLPAEEDKPKSRKSK